MGRGVLYINNGEGFVNEARISAESLKEQNSEIDTAIITDQDEVPEVFDKHIKVDNPNPEVISKVRHLEKTPFEKTLFLDSDIYVDDGVSELFEVLEEFDLACAHASRRTDLREEVPESFPLFNTGVIAFRKNDSTERFLQDWKEKYMEEAEGNSRKIETDEGLKKKPVPDQPSFRQTIYNTEVRIAPLTMRYNCRHGFLGYVDGKVKMFHGRLTDVDSSGRGKDHSMQKAVRKINSTEKKRVFFKKRGRLRIQTDRPWLPKIITNFARNKFEKFKQKRRDAQ